MEAQKSYGLLQQLSFKITLFYWPRKDIRVIIVPSGVNTVIASRVRLKV